MKVAENDFPDDEDQDCASLSGDEGLGLRLTRYYSRGSLGDHLGKRGTGTFRDPEQPVYNVDPIATRTMLIAENLYLENGEDGNRFSTSNNDYIEHADMSSADSHSSGSGTDASSNREREKIVKSVIAAKESGRLRLWRIVLVASILILTCVFCVGTYGFLKSEESSSYEMSFARLVDSIEGSLANKLDNLQQGVRNLGGVITWASKAGDGISSMGVTFPFVLVDDFEVHGSNARDRSKMESIMYAPILDVNATSSLVAEWERFSVDHQDWIETSRANFIAHLPSGREPPVYLPGDISTYVYQRRDGIYAQPACRPNQEGSGADDQNLCMPLWYISPPPMNPAVVNLDLNSKPEYRNLIKRALSTRRAVLTPVVDDVESILSLLVSDQDHLRYHQNVNHVKENSVGYDQPHILYARPVFSTPDGHDNGDIVGVLVGVSYLASLLPEGIDGLFCVVRSFCSSDERGRSFTFELNGHQPIFLGEGDGYHPEAYEHVVRRIPLFQTDEKADPATSPSCSSYIEVFPSSNFVMSFDSSVTLVATLTVAASFALVALIFGVYDFLVNDRNRKVVDVAEKSTAIVRSLFPEQVCKRIMNVETERRNQNQKKALKRSRSSDDEGEKTQSEIIADLFPSTTIMFADVVGFTSWSSAREPAQVFELLETLYSSFDEIAKRLKIFKVETVGDCYVAASGVPTQRNDHALAMARFARAAVARAHEVTRDLASVLGPGTEDLSMRVGIHSGPVTAGVLRGDNARFQLFGDTMNVTARIESTGMADRIHISADTAEHLMAAGKGKWITRRETMVEAKGKGTLQTYWLEMSGRRSCVDSSEHSFDSRRSLDSFNVLATADPPNEAELSVQIQRLVAWICPVLLQKLSALCKARNSCAVLADDVEGQLKAYVISVALRYRENPFHNFDHAIHVTMSVSKLMSRVVKGNSQHTFANRITNDLTLQLSLLFSALIHDMDHEGVPNSQLTKEKPALSARFENQSVAEKNSLEMAWDLLLQPQYEALFKCVAPTLDEFAKFRETVELVTLSTDIMDRDLKADRERRWNLTFDGSKQGDDDSKTTDEADDLKVQIVLEHLIQASDVCHTMQHWQIYRKWNERLFRETYKAWIQGRAPHSPEKDWYKGEIGFFDFYIIPLAKKLADCGVFGVSSDEYLNYAMRNRARWEIEGEEAVQTMILDEIDGLAVTALSGQNYDITFVAGKALFGGQAEAVGTASDINELTRNGVVHFIDHVLISLRIRGPDAATPSPSPDAPGTFQGADEDETNSSETEEAEAEEDAKYTNGDSYTDSAGFRFGAAVAVVVSASLFFAQW